ncbi:hypothetical protein PMIN03_012525 [Paraphaeosphaeria minitans]
MLRGLKNIQLLTCANRIKKTKTYTMTDHWSPGKKWTLTAIRDWAGAEFPDAFATLPDVDGLEFVEVDDEMMSLSPFRLPPSASKKLFRIGFWDGFSDDHHDPVFAYLYGEQHSQVGYIREDSDATPKRYRKLQSRNMYRVDVEEPLCNISGGSERATLTRLRTLVCYFFIAAGHYIYFGDYDSFTKEFQRACLFIEHGSVKASQPEPNQPSSCTASFSTDAESNHQPREAESVLVKLEDLGGIRSDDTMVASSPIASSPIRPSARARPQAAKRPLLPDRSNVNDMLADINRAYAELEKGNKRLKLTMTETRAEAAKSIAALRFENAKLKTSNRALESRNNKGSPVAGRHTSKQAEPDRENSDRKLARLHNAFKRRLERAQHGAREADLGAGLGAGGAFEAMGTPYVGKGELEMRLCDQTERADVAEKKLADIRTYVGQRM